MLPNSCKSTVWLPTAVRYSVTTLADGSIAAVAFANNVVSPADISEKTYGPASSSKKAGFSFSAVGTVNTPNAALAGADSAYVQGSFTQEELVAGNFVAMDDSKLIGCVMCGHDGRRGYLQHLVVSQEYRKKRLGKKLADFCIDALEKIGILKTHLFVFKTNNLGNTFWPNQGYKLREDVNMYSHINSNNMNV